MAHSQKFFQRVRRHTLASLGSTPTPAEATWYMKRFNTLGAEMVGSAVTFLAARSGRTLRVVPCRCSTLCSLNDSVVPVAVHLNNLLTAAAPTHLTLPQIFSALVTVTAQADGSAAFALRYVS